MIEQCVVCVDWDARSLRVVHAAIRRRRVTIDLADAAQYPAGTDVANPELMGRLIRKTLDEQRIKTKKMIVDVPRDQAVFNTLTVPKADPNDLPSVVKFQVAKELPFSLAESVVDFAITSEDNAAGTCEVLVVAVRNDVLDFYRQVAQHAGMKLERVGFRPYANRVAVAEVLRHALPERVLFVDVGPALTEIDVIRGGNLIFSRAASVAVPITNFAARDPEGFPKRDSSAVAPDMTKSSVLRLTRAVPGDELSDVVRSVVVEVTRSLESYSRTYDPGATIDHVIVGGGCGIEEELAEALQKKLNVPAETYNPAGVYGWPPERGALACAFAATLGLASGHAAEGRLEFNFIHPKEAVPAGRVQLRRAYLYAVAASIFIAAFGAFYWQSVRPSRAELAKIKSDIAAMKKKESDHKKLAELMKPIDAFDGEQVVWIDALLDLIEVLPEPQQVVLTKIDMHQRSRKFTLTLNFKERSLGHYIVGKLEEYEPRADGFRPFDAMLGPAGPSPNPAYPFQATINVRVLTPPRAGTAEKAAAAASVG